jgi:hypothetical protein
MTAEAQSSKCSKGGRASMPLLSLCITEGEVKQNRAQKPERFLGGKSRLPGAVNTILRHLGAL